MLKLITAIALVLSITSANAAQKAIDVGTCGEMWRAHKASPGYVDPGKYKRSEAWNMFRKEKCSKDRVETTETKAN